MTRPVLQRWQRALLQIIGLTTTEHRVSRSRDSDKKMAMMQETGMPFVLGATRGLILYFLTEEVFGVSTESQDNVVSNLKLEKELTIFSGFLLLFIFSHEV